MTSNSVLTPTFVFLRRLAPTKGAADYTKIGKEETDEKIEKIPVADPPIDFEPDGTFFSMVAVRGDFYAVEPNHGQVLRVTPGGEITRLIDVSAILGHIVPTAITYKGDFFVGNLGTFPIVPGSQQVIKLNPGGNVRTWATGLTTVLGLAFDGRDRLYVLESLTNPGFPGPGQLNSGRVVRIDPSGVKTGLPQD